MDKLINHLNNLHRVTEDVNGPCHDRTYTCSKLKMLI